MRGLHEPDSWQSLGVDTFGAKHIWRPLHLPRFYSGISIKWLSINRMVAKHYLSLDDAKKLIEDLKSIS